MSLEIFLIHALHPLCSNPGSVPGLSGHNQCQPTLKSHKLHYQLWVTSPAKQLDHRVQTHLWPLQSAAMATKIILVKSTCPSKSFSTLQDTASKSMQFAMYQVTKPSGNIEGMLKFSHKFCKIVAVPDLLKDVPRTIYGLGLQVVEPSAPYFGSHGYYPIPQYHYHLPVISTTTSSLLYASALWVPLPASTRIWVPTNSAATEQN